MVREIGYFVNEISIYLLLGFSIAALLHVLFPESFVRRHLGKNSLASVIKATLVGIPLPLCSCGVVPVAASLRRSGSSKGATVSFLIATPQIGADSFLLTYSLLGWVFGIFRILASLLTAFAAGLTVNIVTRGEDSQPAGPGAGSAPSEGRLERFRTILPYIEYDLLGSIANSLLVGLLLAGAITALLPDGFFEKYLNSNLGSMLLMMAVGIPMYVCASASTPIAASLIMKGLSPGAALVFLLTGPATNAVTITTVLRILGRRSAAVYLLAIALVALALGYLMNLVVARFGFNRIILVQGHSMLPAWLKGAGTVLLAAMMAWYYFKTRILDGRKGKIQMTASSIRLKVEGMTCMHCSETVKKTVESVQGARNVSVDLKGKSVSFELEDARRLDKVKSAIRAAGYNPE